MLRLQKKNDQRCPHTFGHKVWYILERQEKIEMTQSNFSNANICAVSHCIISHVPPNVLRLRLFDILQQGWWCRITRLYTSAQIPRRQNEGIIFTRHSSAQLLLLICEDENREKRKCSNSWVSALPAHSDRIHLLDISPSIIFKRVHLARSHRPHHFHFPSRHTLPLPFISRVPSTFTDWDFGKLVMRPSDLKV